jgi:hypothetical protein
LEVITLAYGFYVKSVNDTIIKLLCVLSNISVKTDQGRRHGTEQCLI